MEQRPKALHYEVRDLEFAKQDWPPVRYLIENLIREKSINIIYGNGGMGKTYILLDLALSIASGKEEWMGNKILEAVPVLYINAEMEEQDFSIRVKEVFLGESISPKTNFKFINSSEFVFENPQTEIELKKLIDEHKVKLLVLDALSDILGGRNNGADEVQPFFRFLKRIRAETGVTILIVHHNNRTGTYLGSVDIRNQCDYFVELQGQETTFVWKSDKSRFAGNIVFSGSKNWEDGVFYLTEAKGIKGKLGKRLENILNTIPELEILTVESILELLEKSGYKISQSTLYRELKKLEELGYLYVANPLEQGQGVKKMYGKTELNTIEKIVSCLKK